MRYLRLLSFLAFAFSLPLGLGCAKEEPEDFGVKKEALNPKDAKQGRKQLMVPNEDEEPPPGAAKPARSKR
jgi:hypothetical protein